MTNVLYRLPGKDERAVRLAATVQGLSNAIAAWDARCTLKNDATNRAVMAIHAYPAWMNLRDASGDRQGTNSPARFAAIFVPLCQRIHAALYSSLESDPALYHQIVDGERDLLSTKLTAVALASLPTIENTPTGEPIIFSWSENRARVS